MKVKTTSLEKKRVIFTLFFQQAQTQQVPQPVTATTQTVSSVPRTYQVVINSSVKPEIVPSAKSGSPITPTAVSVAAAKGTIGEGRGSKRKTPPITVFSAIPFIGKYTGAFLAKKKFQNFLTDLLRLAEEQPPSVSQHVWALVNQLITGKSLSEALIFASTNPQYDNNYKFNTVVPRPALSLCPQKT